MTRLALIAGAGAALLILETLAVIARTIAQEWRTRREFGDVNSFRRRRSLLHSRPPPPNAAR